MVVVDVKYKFIMVDFGAYGRLSDDSVFAISNIGRTINGELLDVPDTRRLDISDKEYPYIFLGEEALPLRISFIKPYSKHSLSIAESLANNRKLRVRWAVENAFGFRFRIPLNFVYFTELL